MKCAFIKEERVNHHLRILCKAIGVSHATYYRWSRAQLLPSQKRDAELLKHIRFTFKKSRKTYGARRVREGLQRAGFPVSRKRISRIMQQFELHAVRSKSFIRTTNSKHAFPLAPNLLDRNFEPLATMLNSRWAGDVTYIGTREGWLYLAVILDLTSRRVIGFATGAKNDRYLVLDALRMAVANRPHVTSVLLFHSDRGVTYAATECREALTRLKITCSMSNKAECLDNAVIESFNATIKRELIDRQEWDSHDQVALSISEYIISWYNAQRFHSSLGYMSPVEFEIAIISEKISILEPAVEPVSLPD